VTCPCPVNLAERPCASLRRCRMSPGPPPRPPPPLARIATPWTTWLAALTVAAFAVRACSCCWSPVRLCRRRGELGGPGDAGARPPKPGALSLPGPPDLLPAALPVLHRRPSAHLLQPPCVLWVQRRRGAPRAAVARPGGCLLASRGLAPPASWPSIRTSSGSRSLLVETLFVVLLWWAIERVLRSDPRRPSAPPRPAAFSGPRTLTVS